VTLASPAPPGGAFVQLVSGVTALATVPGGLFIPAGETTATFPILTKIVKSPPSVVILAIYQGVASAATLNVISPIPSITELALHNAFGGGDLLLTKADGDFAVIAGGFTGAVPIDTVAIFFNGARHFWSLHFSTRALGTPLLPGTFLNGQRYPFEGPGHPGLSVSGDGIGCNTLTGQFTVLDITFDNAFSPPLVASLAIEFEQHCEGGADAMTGHIFYNYTPPGSYPGPFDLCIQDESGGGLLQINTTSGAYQFVSCSGLVAGGTARVSKRGNQITLQQASGDRRLTASIDTGTRKAIATFQLLSQGRTFTIIDRDITNNTCSCN